MICPPSKRDTNTRLTGNVPPLGMFCILGSLPLNLPVDVMCWFNLTCNIPSALILFFMPPTKEERYVSSADNLCTFSKNSRASGISFLFAALASNSRLRLLVEKPLAVAHLALGGINFKPATALVGIT